MSETTLPQRSLESHFSSFTFEGDNTVRSFLDANGDPWFVATDACKAMGYANPSQAVSDNVEPEDKAYVSRDDDGTIRFSSKYTGEGTQLLVVNESGLYVLIFNSRKPEAKRFKKWITSEVLPAIRNTGVYSIEPLSPAELILVQAQRLVEHERQLANHDQRIDSLEARADARDQWSHHFTVIGYCNLRKFPQPTWNQAASWGKRASALSRERGVAIGKTTDPRFGEVGTYHVSILEEVIASDN